MNDALVFPQLKGSISFCPQVSTRVDYRTVVNSLLGNSRVTFSDPNSTGTEWLLNYEEISDSDLQLLLDFFESCRGQLRSFQFCPPEGNLLIWSERFQEKPWIPSPLVTVEAISDGIYSLRNTSQQAAGLGQAAAVPKEHEVCFGVRIRAESPCRVWLKVESGETSVVEQLAGDEWNDWWVSHESAGSTVRCRVEIEAGCTVHIQQAYLVPQRHPAAYTPSRQASALSLAARFADDTIRIETVRPNAHAVSFRVRAGKPS